MLNTTLQKALRARAHHLNPVILIGVKGLTESVLTEIDQALEAHELIKIKVRGHEKEACKSMATIICNQLDAELVQLIGGTLTLFRKKRNQNSQ